MSEFDDPIYTNDDAAREHIEKLRWANGRFCPHCGETERTSPVGGDRHRPGLYYCNGCKGQFSVTVGTIFERSHILLHKWVLGFHLMASSKKGISAHQLHRTLHLPYKTAWFRTARTAAAREAARARWSRPTRPTSATARRPSRRRSARG